MSKNLKKKFDRMKSFVNELEMEIYKSKVYKLYKNSADDTDPLSPRVYGNDVLDEEQNSQKRHEMPLTDGTKKGRKRKSAKKHSEQNPKNSDLNYESQSDIDQTKSEKIQNSDEIETSKIIGHGRATKENNSSKKGMGEKEGLKEENRKGIPLKNFTKSKPSKMDGDTEQESKKTHGQSKKESSKEHHRSKKDTGRKETNKKESGPSNKKELKEESSKKSVPIGLDKDRLQSIVVHFKNLKLPKGENKYEPSVESDVQKDTEKRFKEAEPEQPQIPRDASEDNRYIYHLKKLKLTYDYMNKEVCKQYILERSKSLRDRCIKNQADDLGPRFYTTKEETNDKNEKFVVIESSNGNKTTTCRLQKLPEMGYYEISDYDRGEFEYAVYKFGDDLYKMSRYLDLDIKKTILLYYVNHSKFRITDALCEIVAVREWCEEDKETFAKCYRKYGRKYENYFNYIFRDQKSEQDIEVYYFYYNNKIIGEKWSVFERGLFQSLFALFRKDWEMYVSQGIKIINFENDEEKRPDTVTSAIINYDVLNKPISDIKSYYNNYYKKLSEQELENDYHRYAYRVEEWKQNEIMRRYQLLNRKMRKKQQEVAE